MTEKNFFDEVLNKLMGVNAESFDGTTARSDREDDRSADEIIKDMRKMRSSVDDFPKSLFNTIFLPPEMKVEWDAHPDGKDAFGWGLRAFIAPGLSNCPYIPNITLNREYTDGIRIIKYHTISGKPWVTYTKQGKTYICPEKSIREILFGENPTRPMAFATKLTGLQCD